VGGGKWYQPSKHVCLSTHDFLQNEAVLTCCNFSGPSGHLDKKPRLFGGGCLNLVVRMMETENFWNLISLPHRFFLPIDGTLCLHTQVIECVQDIPCNPCERARPKGTIFVGNPINNLPVFFADKCDGCRRSIPLCPGQAIFRIDMTYSN